MSDPTIQNADIIITPIRLYLNPNAYSTIPIIRVTGASLLRHFLVIFLLHELLAFGIERMRHMKEQ